ncbi:MAG TPA: hypothetical protein PLQ80_09065 [Candidatus Syntrophosphaera sp.]|nr:hypothetical protein [Candidatus Syntrophosphaera sp.]HPH61905.1 hypothetical protein [Candidatus Syntrophosphaera sp.]
MKIAVMALIFTLSLAWLAGQRISNVRITQHPELRYYRVTFDLMGDPEEAFTVRVLPRKQDIPFNRDPQHPSLEGRGVKSPCFPGRDLQIFWNPDLEGLDTEGWEFELVPELRYTDQSKTIEAQVASWRGQIDQVYLEDPAYALQSGTFTVIMDIAQSGAVKAHVFSDSPGLNPSFLAGIERIVESWSLNVTKATKYQFSLRLSPR